MADLETPELPKLSEENFKRLSPESCRIFAFRAAVRVMPLIGGGANGLEFWPNDDRRRYLAVVVAVVDVLLLSLNNRAIYALPIASRAAYAAATAATTTATARIHYDVARAYADAAAMVDAAAAATKVSVAVSSEAAVIAMQWDLQQLLQLSGKAEKSVRESSSPVSTSTELLTIPLWRQPDGQHQLPEEWGNIIERWRSSMAELEMEDVVRRYMDLVDGKPWDIDETERRFNAWYEEYGKEGVTTKEENNPEDADIPIVVGPGGNSSPNADGPTTDDALGREALVKALAAFLDHEKYEGKTTIGLLGHWGAGKSSVLEMLTDALNKESKSFSPAKATYLCATFNAWAYEHTDNIQAGMAQEVVNGLTENTCFGQRLGLACRFARKTEPLKSALVFYGLPLFWLLALIWFGFLEVEFTKEWKEELLGGGAVASLLLIWKSTKTVFAHTFAEKLQTYLRLPSFGKHIGQIPIIQSQVRALCELILTPDGDGDDETKTNNKRLLLKIDDLDRCSEEGIVKTLEAVKLVMDLPNVTTIVAVDHRMVLAALSVHYYNLADKGSNRTAHEIARDYLGKIFTIPIQLDTPGEGALEGYVKERLFTDMEALSESDDDTSGSDNPSMNNESPSLDKVDGKDQKQVEKEKGNNPPGEGAGENPNDQSEIDPVTNNAGDVAPVGPDGRESVALADEVIKDTPDEREHFIQLSNDLKILNPRQLKRLHNSYRLLKALAFHRGGDKRGFTKNERKRVMAMLFWMERISCQDKEMRDCEEKYLQERQMQTGKELQLAEKIYDDLAGYFGLSSRDGETKPTEEELKGYKQLKARVKVFMLPYAEITNDEAEDKLQQIKEVVRER